MRLSPCNYIHNKSKGSKVELLKRNMKNNINLVNREVKTKSEEVMHKLFYIGREKKNFIQCSVRDGMAEKRDQSANWS